MDRIHPRASTFGAVTGVAMGIVGLLTSFWIPTLAAMFAAGALVSGFTRSATPQALADPSLGWRSGSASERCSW